MGSCLNIKMLSYKYRYSHYKDKESHNLLQLRLHRTWLTWLAAVVHWPLHMIQASRFLASEFYRENCSWQPVSCGNIDSKINQCTVLPGFEASKHVLLLHSYVFILQCLCCMSTILLALWCVNAPLSINSLRLSDTYMRQKSNNHWFR